MSDTPSSSFKKAASFFQNLPWKRIFITSCKILAVMFLIGLVTSVATIWYFSKGLPTLKEVTDYQPVLRTSVYDRDGQFIHAFYEENREWADLEEIPKNLRHTIVAVEDVRFYKHWGLDARRFWAAMIRNIQHLEARQGASTLTQQLARNAFLTHQKTLSRKIRELLMAIKIERTYTKQQILELYLNQIYFGAGCYGVGTISKKYFGKSISELNQAQCTFLAGLPKNPENYSPFNDMERGKFRHKVVLNVLEKQGLITSLEADALWEQDLEIVPTSDSIRSGAYFIEELRKYLVEKYGSEFVYRSGGRVYTTLDKEWQRSADRLFSDHFKLLDEKIATSDSVNRVQGALLALDPKTSGILAMIGGRDFSTSQFNRAVQAKRQAGSAFKPFVYATAIRQGYSPADVILDISDPIKIGGKIWAPRNINRKFYGQVTLRTALNKSLNASAVRLLKKIGIQQVVSLTKEMGIQSTLPPYPSLALGTADVSLLEMVSAYAVFANQGIYQSPYFIEKIIDQNDLIIEENFSMPQEVLTKEEAAVMVSMLRTVVDNGSGYGARRAGFWHPAGGKTGTTDNYKDAWFIGFSPHVAAGVWIGFDRNQSLGRSMTGSQAALPVWAKFMSVVHDSLPAAYFKMPKGVQRISICQVSGKIASSECTNTAEDVIANVSDRKRRNVCTSCAIRVRQRERPKSRGVEKIPTP
ncbi:MAG: hypothetical protein B6244_06870 [Candidatus Cloacimonetes bacterium 4572_55]|nr:MAG: hypothetical protein B6244_06870 [Candidatus Cloacimonetes bacterium 4572_55]